LLDEQTPLEQSLGAPQALPSAHVGHVPPPQSVSDSSPFWTPSPQLAAWQTLDVHTSL
jgi:hypothetical protein